jgi:hypothetical protein
MDKWYRHVVDHSYTVMPLNVSEYRPQEGKQGLDSEHVSIKLG